MQAYTPEPSVEDINIVANISELLSRDGYINKKIVGISVPHVFHIIRVNDEDSGRMNAGIYVKNSWSGSLEEDPWSPRPFFLLKKKINYRETPHAEMRQPRRDKVDSMDRGLQIFKEKYPEWYALVEITNTSCII